jgi:hypothetical protein
MTSNVKTEPEDIANDYEYEYYEEEDEIPNRVTSH